MSEGFPKFGGARNSDVIAGLANPNAGADWLYEPRADGIGESLDETLAADLEAWIVVKLGDIAYGDLVTVMGRILELTGTTEDSIDRQGVTVDELVRRQVAVLSPVHLEEIKKFMIELSDRGNDA